MKGQLHITLRGKNERASERLSFFWRDDSSEHGVFPDVPRRSRSEEAERG
ncbi:MAG: hypothetical protein HZB59_02235 [Ignavibacteriales bacterium]|nr:hypothetical protein [Ignavibacteriales bacterium]